MSDEAGQSGDWLTPGQVSKQFGINNRRVYRLIERGELAARGENDRKFVSRDSVEQFLRQEEMRQLVSAVIPGDTPPAEIKTSLVRSDAERAQLMTRIAEDARTIGELTERTRHLDTLTEEVSGLRVEVTKLTGKYERFRVLFWVMLALFVIVVVIFSVLLYVNT